MIMLVIITAMVLFSTSVGYFEQRTTTNQNRARIAQRSAEYALSLAGEYVKANHGKLISNDAEKGGRLSANTRRWATCADVGNVGTAGRDSEFTEGHTCL